MYQWTITKDHLADPTEHHSQRDDAGTVGPSTATLSHDEIVAHPDAKPFRMFDDDGELYYDGVIIGEYDGFEPLDDFGTPNAGATEIKFKEEGGWRPL